MPGYIAATLHKFQHQPPTRAQHAPYQWNEPEYGTNPQLTNPVDGTAPLPPDRTKRLQQITEKLLYYAQAAVDPIMLVALQTIDAQQSNVTENTADAIVKLLNYCATHPVSTVRYQASNMILRIHSAMHPTCPKPKHEVDRLDIFISATNRRTTLMSTTELSSQHLSSCGMPCPQRQKQSAARPQQHKGWCCITQKPC
jgi:hypothetical protein